MMTAKEYLQQIRNVDLSINAKLEQVEQLRLLSVKVTPTVSDTGFSGGGSGDKLGGLVAKICDLEAEINGEIDRLVNLKREVAGVIGKIQDSNQQIILQLRYLNQKKWEVIAVEMPLDLRWVYKLHSRALLELEKLI